nr:hypothetical protein [Pseudomonas syringae pv. theae]
SLRWAWRTGLLFGGAWELQEVTTAAMGCKAALKQTTSAVSGTPKWLVLLPVPGSSRTSEASPEPLHRNALFDKHRVTAATGSMRKQRVAHLPRHLLRFD